MVSEEVEKKLYNAASNGDVTTLVHLLEEDPYLVHGVSFPCSRNLLHIAAMYGQTSIVEQVLKLNPQLACISDSQESSPLHIAAARGHVEIASKLVSVAPEMCWWRDKQGMNPIHVAAMNGHVQILEHLLIESCFPAMERLHRGQTVLHLCVKHAQLRALKVLVEKLGDLVCTKDDDGDTLLHLAVRCNQLQIVEYLVDIDVLKQETRNGMGKTAAQILNDSPPTTTNYVKMKRRLTAQSDHLFLKVLPEMSNTLMVVIVLIATMAFQSAITPVGGVWAEDDAKNSRRAGQAVMASTNPNAYMSIRLANTAAFLCSLLAMYLFTFRVQLENYTSAFILVSGIAMGAALTALMITFLKSMDAVTPDEVSPAWGNKIMCGLLIIVVIWACYKYVKRLYWSWVNKKKRQIDISVEALHHRLFYWIFGKLETGGI